MSNHIFPVVTESEKRLPFYITGIGCQYHQEHVKRPEGYPNFQWIQCHRGEGQLILEDKHFIIRPQQGMFLFPGIAHEYFEIKTTWEVDWIGFNGFMVDSLANRLGFVRSGVYYVIHGEAITAKMRYVLTVAQSKDPFKGLECSAITYGLLLDLFKYTSPNMDDSLLQQHSRLKPALDYIEENFSGVITLEALAATIQVTPQHLCLLFKNILKLRPFEYLNQVRINKSKDLMFSGRAMEIKNIARLVGYDNVSYFCAVFKRVEGITPGQFRKLHGV